MKKIKKLQTVLLKNIKIVIIILISMILSYIMFYFDLFDLFNNKYVNLEPELLELKEKLKEIKIEEESNLEKIPKNDNNKIIYYVISGVLLMGVGVFLFYYFNDKGGSGNNTNFTEDFQEILRQLEELDLKRTYDKDTGRWEASFPSTEAELEAFAARDTN